MQPSIYPILSNLLGLTVVGPENLVCSKPTAEPQAGYSWITNGKQIKYTKIDKKKKLEQDVKEQLSDN